MATSVRTIRPETRNGPIHSAHKSPPGINLTLECPLTVLSICNLRPRAEWELFTVPIRYPRYLQPMSVPEVNSKIDNQTLIRYFYRFDKNYLPEEIIEIFFLFLLKIKDRAFSIAIKSDRKVIASKQFKVFPFVPHPLFLYITLSISSSTDSSLRITIIPPSLYFIRYQSRRGAKRPRV